VLTRTSTGILSNRAPDIGTPVTDSGATTPDSSAVLGPRLSLMAMAKREAAKRNLYSNFYRGPVLRSDDLKAETVSVVFDAKDAMGALTTLMKAHDVSLPLEQVKPKKRKSTDDAGEDDEKKERKRLKKLKKSAEKQERKERRKQERDVKDAKKKALKKLKKAQIEALRQVALEVAGSPSESQSLSSTAHDSEASKRKKKKRIKDPNSQQKT
jgi:hypothetical protein